MKSFGKHRYFALVLALTIMLAWGIPASAQNQFIVRAPGGLNVVQTLCGLVGCNLLESLNDPAAQLYVIRTSNPSLLNFLLELLGIVHIEPDLLVNLLLPPQYLIKPGTQAPPGLLQNGPVVFYGAPVWSGYANQPAANIIRAAQARSTFGVSGAALIGVIDTGVDPNHPALMHVLVRGYDFTRNRSGGSEMADLNQSTAAVVDGTPIQVSGTTIAVLNQSTAAVVDTPGYSAFGHGTMVAGIAHLVSPASRIMPLKAFTAKGTGNTSDIIRAIYYGVRSGVDVLNMSFSVSSSSAELDNALEYANSKGVVCVASAGNQGRNMTVYPAGYAGDVMGVGSTTLTDTRSGFSNYGADVWVAAPGEGIISTYPMGTYAAGWGTSFSAPLVTGTAGLLLQLRPNYGESQSAWAIGHAKSIGSGLGHGRLDVVSALAAAKLGQ